jgi:type VI secretion system secreted protein VgrG
MVDNATQSTRQMAVATPFGDDVLLLRRFSGQEELSRLFEYELEMLSADDGLNPTQIVGQNVTWVLNQSGDVPRYFNGYVNRFRYAGQTDQWTVYRATVVPWLWFLTQTRDCRIFQQQSVPEIVEEVFADFAGLANYELKLSEDYAEREYCVQYRESDFAFVSRLLEEEGIFYFIRSDNGRHTLVLADSPDACFVGQDPEVDFTAPDSTGDLVDQITHWEHHYEFRPGRMAQQDFNFKSPSRSLMSQDGSVAEFANNSNYEIYDYPGRYEEPDAGRRRTRVRMEEYELPHDTVSGKATYRHFMPGAKFTVRSHRTSSEVGREYALTASEISASVGGTYDTAHVSDEDVRFECRFHCIPAATVFRPRRDTPQPIVEGPQTAVVVGPPGEEIYPDEFGRVKVQFHWDREGSYDENSSCWLRVSQVHAGAGWGSMDLPRIGEEVIVDFLEGDPDKPIISGRVYNGNNRPPFDLPAHKTRSGGKTQTHKGAGYNEISMDDTAGAEQIRLNGQYNMDSVVGNNQTLVVGVDRTSEIGNNDALTVGVDQVEQVGSNKSVTVGSDMNVDVGSKLVFNAGSKITLKCGASKITMNSGGVITISGTIITTAAAANAAVAAPLTQVVGGVMLTTVGGINMMSGGVCHVGAAALASVAGSKVDIAGAGKTAIKGGIITLN